MNFGMKLFRADGTETKLVEHAEFFGLTLNGEVVEYFTSRTALYLAADSIKNTL
jgi:hypothetical protein